MSVTVRPDFIPGDDCPCGISGCTGSKLTRFAHVVGCVCRSCLGRRSRRKGQAGQARMHRSLGGEGFTPSNEESARPYTVTVLPEAKTGAQIPASFAKFVTLDWTRRAFSQSERGLPMGAGALPALFLSLPGGGQYLVVRLKAQRLGGDAA